LSSSLPLLSLSSRFGHQRCGARTVRAGTQVRSAQLWFPHTSWQSGTRSAVARADKTRLSAGLPDSRHRIVPAETPDSVAS
jgi:hypothetical protein